MIRGFRKEDTIAVAQLAQKTFAYCGVKRYYDQPGLPALLDEFDVNIRSERELFETLDGADFFCVCEQEGVITGFLRGSKEHLKTLAVDPDRQGSGIGAKMVRAFEKWARENGSERIDVHAAVYASDFYEKMGYVKQGEETLFKGLDIYNMYKKLLHKEKRMKQFTVLIDGMADRAQEALGGKTPLEAANTPNLDALYAAGRPGTVKTIPVGMEAGSAVANMNLLGYDPRKVFKGRAVIEAAGAGIPIDPNHLYIRTNFVSVQGDNFDDSVMDSYSAHGISSERAQVLVDRLNEQVFAGFAKLISIGKFRNILVVDGRADIAEKLKFMPSNEMIGKRSGDYANGSDIENEYYDLMRKAYEVLKEDNDSRANAIWFWGASYAPSFGEPPQQKRMVLAETTLMRGLAALAGMDSAMTDESRGFEAFLEGKMRGAIEAVQQYDYVYIHIQKLDDLSHELLPERKTQALEQIDKLFVGPFFEELEAMGIGYSGVVLSDHFTFSDNGGHGAEPTPFILLGQGSAGAQGAYTEENCRRSELHLSAAELVSMQRKES